MKSGIIAILAKRAAGKKPAEGDGEGYDEPEAKDDEAEEGSEDETRMAGVSIATDIREALSAKDDEKLYDALCELIKNHAG